MQLKQVRSKSKIPWEEGGNTADQEDKIFYVNKKHRFKWGSFFCPTFVGGGELKIMLGVGVKNASRRDPYFPALLATGLN